MKLHEALKQELFNHGLSEDQAQQVFEMYHAYLEMHDRYMYDRIMTSETTDYPPLLTRMQFMECARFAVAWIDLNAPKHWTRAMFAELSGEKPKATCDADVVSE